MSKSFYDFHRGMLKDGHGGGKAEGSVAKTNLSVGQSTDKKGFVSVKYKEVQFLMGNITLGKETLFALMSLNSNEVRILFFIVAYDCDKKSAQFQWGPLESSNYEEFFTLATGKTVGAEFVRQVLHSLRKKNIIKRIKRNKYMLNPRYLSITNKSTARALLNHYHTIQDEVTLGSSKKL